MMNETIIAFNNATSLPITVVSSVSKGQFTISVVLSLLSLAFILYWIYGNTELRIKEKLACRKLKKITGRPTLFINHKMSGGLFGSVEMIDEKTMHKISKFLNKHPAQPVNIVLHTPGGVVFHSQAIANEIFQRGNVHVYVPSYAMSGGTLLSLAAYRLYMSPTAALGPVDPQLGYFWSGYSTESHNKVVKAKGNKAADSSIAFANEGNKCLVEIQSDVKRFLEKNGAANTSINKNVLYLTDGRFTHGKRMGMNEISSIRTVESMKPEVQSMLVKAL